ncbi:hypothetical protein BSU04_44030 [Caballeronia sordidicola]|uniref:Uncharacterized protein n=1 Tax=Caballeronia sordidicola TaxID=196367 RepID=A0A226WLG8_CABSO|nr:hypothetical protein BSU04_44030 [Caballeronia sordidicola]
MSAHALGIPMEHGPHLQIDRLQRTEGPLHDVPRTNSSEAGFSNGALKA